MLISWCVYFSFLCHCGFTWSVFELSSSTFGEVIWCFVSDWAEGHLISAHCVSESLFPAIAGGAPLSMSSVSKLCG